MCANLRYRILASALCVVCITGTASAANLHYLLLCDTLDPSIGTVDDLANSQTWARTIAEKTGLTLQLKTLYGANLTAANARAMLNALQPGSDDVVFFHYSGHGGNPGTSIWPVFCLTTNPDDMPASEQLSFDQVVGIVRPKSPRLLVMVSDACNNYPGQTGRARPYTPPGTDPAVSQAFKDLFTAIRGEVLTTGCKPGQYSLGAPGEGGVFFNSLTTAVADLATTQSPLTWDAVMARAATLTAAAARGYNSIQEPQYQVNVTQVSGTTTTPVTSTPVAESPTTPPSVDQQVLSAESDNPSQTKTAACGPMGLLSLTACATGLSLLRVRRRRDR